MQSNISMAMKQTKSLHFSLLPAPEVQQISIGAVVQGSILAILFFLGIGGMLYWAFAPSAMLEILIPIGIAGCVIFTFVLRKRSLRRWGLIILALWLVGFCMILQTDVLNGLCLTANRIGEVLGQSFGRIYPIYDISVDQSGYELSTTLFFIPVSLLLSLLSGYLAYTHDTAVSLAITAGIIFIYVFLKIEIAVIWLLLLVLAQFLLLAQTYGNRQNFYGGFTTAYRSVAAIAAGVFALSAIVVFLTVPSYENSPLKNTRESLIRTVDQIRYGVEPTLGMPDGDFTNLQAFEPSDETALEVTMEKPESLWLRGYVGSVYNGHGWSESDSKSLYEYADIFYWLHRDNFYGQKQLADAAAVTGEASYDQAFGIHVNNVGASSRNIYAPYELYMASGELMPADIIGDTALVSTGFRGQRQYEYLSLPNIVKRYPDIMRELYGDDAETKLSTEAFLTVESNYAEYVYEQYTQLPEDTMRWIEQYLSDVLPAREEANYANVKQAIIQYLTEQTEYSTEPSQAGSGDFAYDFLFLDKEGYSVHYATAATLMFRACGIPARYVEGYLITPQDVQGAADHSVFQIDGTHAHAWVEVYQSGVGWIPVEVTPPYFGLMEEADSLEGVPGTRPESTPAASPENTVENQEEIPNQVDGEKAVAGNLLLIILIIVLAAAAIFFLWRYWKKRQMQFKKKVEACLNEKNNEAITAMFICAMDALSTLGLKDGGVWLLEQLRRELKPVDGVSEKRIAQVFAVYEEATYSAHATSQESRKEMEDFIEEVYLLLRERFVGLKRLKVYGFLKLAEEIKSAHEKR